MHLLAAQAGSAQQEGEAIDLGQSPAPLCILSAADSELAMLAAAADRAGNDDLRLANLLRLSHNLSVDLWIEQTARHAGLIIVRLLGGAAYWPYGVDELTALARAGRQIAFLSGDANPDPLLRDRSSIDPADWSRLHALFTAGGPDNFDTLLQLGLELASPDLSPPSPLRGGAGGGGPSVTNRTTPLPTSPSRGEERIEDGQGAAESPAPTPFPRFGHYHPSTGLTLDAPNALPPSPLRGGVGGGGPSANHTTTPLPPSPSRGEEQFRVVERAAAAASAAPIIPILFYRAALEGAGTATVDALIAELEAQNLQPLPLVVSSLKEGACLRFVQATFAAFPPSVILNLTGFALGLDGLDDKQSPFAGVDAPVIQLIQSGRPEAQWAADIQGLSAKDLAMQLVLPELDGRIGGLLVGHKADAVWHARTQCPLSSYASDANGIRRAVTLAKNWSTLRSTPRTERRIAIVLANYPIRDGRLANGVGYDAPQSTVEILKALAGAGYALSVGSPSPLRGGDRGGGPSATHSTTPTPSPSPQGGGEREAGALFSNARHVRSHRTTQSRRLRNSATAPERKLWQVLKTFDVHFRRQVPIGNYIADFACHHPMLVIEVDGATHFDDVGIERDRVRDAELAGLGYRVLHISARDVALNPDGIWQLIDATLRDLSVGSPSPLRGGDRGGGPSATHSTTPTPSPSPQGGGEREAGALFSNARHVRSHRTTQSRQLRNSATAPERKLWPVLKTFDVHFRRQVPIGNYIADFACHHPKLVIEVDGATHFDDVGIERDRVRDAELAQLGYRVLHISARDVAVNPDGIWQLIDATLRDLSVGSPSPLRGGDRGGGPSVGHSTTPTPSPSPQGGGEQEIGGVPATAADLISVFQSGPTNANPARGTGIPLPLADYRRLFATLPEVLRAAVTERWGDPAADPFCRGEAFHLPAVRFGNVAILVQPARGYHLDETAAYHDPDLVPPHGYIAAYLWLRHGFAAHAVIHNGKHGNLEWLPGKATALDAASWPAALWAELPHLYPFIVNDPGEGTQAKRRTGAVIIDHLVPPLTRAETYGPLKDLEALLDEYYTASGMDRRRLKDLQQRILDYTRDTRIDRDIGLGPDDAENLRRIDTFLCDLKEAQIRDGLHVFGQSPTGRLERDLAIALARVPRGEGAGEASLIRALADDLKLGVDPLTADLGAPYTGPAFSVGSPSPLRGGDRGGGPSADHLTTPTPDPSPQGGGESEALVPPPRTIGQLVEQLETLAAGLLDGAATAPGPATAAVLETIATTILPRLRTSGPAENAALLDGLDGKFVRPGPSGAPSRGRLDVLPTGRNFYSVDNRAVPTPTAWELGKTSAESLLLRHFQDHGVALRSLALSVWGTSNMRTGGDDIAQAMAFIGVRPAWDPGSLRVSGYEIIPLAKLGRPRVDVTLRISGFFRDAFPAQIALFDRAIRAVGALDEPEDQNPIAARMRTDALGLMAEGAGEAEAAHRAGHRIFGSKPGAYGAGLQGLIDSGNWTGTGDLSKAFLDWGQYAYGAKAQGTPDRARFAARLSDIEAVVHNQDNREHDLLDSDDYYQFEGGLVATAEHLTGRRPAAWHNDHSRPERPLARTLEEEISRVMRSRVVNPKWIAGVQRHGYKGAFEIIATVDYMFAFAATTGAVKTHHFDLAFEAFVEDAATRDFIQQHNRYGWDELLAKFRDARDRGFWTPRSNSAYAWLSGEGT